MKVHLVDGTYELFRSYFGAPEATGADGGEVGATRGLLSSMLALTNQKDVTHVAIAFDSVIESFRNDLFDGYKTGDGIAEDLWRQFPLVERACAAFGITVWRMIDFEADDALAAGAAKYIADPRVTQVVLCSPDKDLAQCVTSDGSVVMLDRRRKITLDHAAVVQKFGVQPKSIPDYLALVGDDADGIPGIPRWGAKSTAKVLARYHHLEAIPADVASWDVGVRGATTLSENLELFREEASLYRTLATLRVDVPLVESVDAIAYKGAYRRDLDAICEELRYPAFAGRIKRWRDEDHHPPLDQ